MSDLHLTILPSVPVWVEGESHVLDRKFHDGMLAYTRAWPGQVTCLARGVRGPLPEFGTVRATREVLPFRLRVIEAEAKLRAEHLAGASVVLAAADDVRQLEVAALCRRIGARCVYVIEYDPQTRHRICALEAPNRLVRLRRDLFLRGKERARRAALREAAAIQSNGTAAHEEYRRYAASHLYFDTRARRDAHITEAALESRLGRLLRGGPLRLAFSGRLIAMKGADHLPRVAARLRDLGIGCHWTVYGAGALAPVIQAEVRTLGLEEIFTMRGPVDFHDRLMPEIQAGTDLYVMPHRQSDPSCTYLETLACGIPIVGYANRALKGLLELAEVGAAAQVEDIEGLANAVARLDADRERLAAMSRAAAAFSRTHTFEDTFQRRIDHLLEVARGTA